MDTIEQRDYRSITVVENGSGGVHIDQSDPGSDGLYDFGVTIEVAAIPALIKALQQYTRRTK